MLIIVDHRCPEPALQRLRQIGEVLLFHNEGATYSSVEGHADLFFCQIGNHWIAAPNTPGKYVDKLVEHGISFGFGKKASGSQYPEISAYNACIEGGVLVHNLHYTDAEIMRLCEKFEQIHVRQGYTRCSLVKCGNLFITGDRGVAKALQDQGKEVIIVKQQEILLPGQKHGFFGGCCGVYGNQLFVCGQAEAMPEYDALLSGLGEQNYKIESLYQGPLVDVGSILFLEA